MEINRGIIQSAQKVVVYGPEGIGKSTFASKFPVPVFSDTEGSTKHMDVFRFDRPTSWTMLLAQVEHIKKNPVAICKTYVIDTADWAEALCVEHICAKSQKTGIEDFGYGKGFTYLAEEFGRLLNRLNEIVELGVNVVITAHAQMRKFEQPDELGAYDRWELKLQKKTAALVKEWSDMLLFANYKTIVVNVDGQGVKKGKNKAQGGSRVMYTQHHPCWDAKNRHNLPDELPFDFSEIAHLIPKDYELQKTKVKSIVPTVPPMPMQEVMEEVKPTPKQEWASATIDSVLPKPLSDLMEINKVSVEEIQNVVGQKGYYPKDTPIENYDFDFINGVLVGAWEQVFDVIKMNRNGFNALTPEEEKDLPF